MRKFSVWRWEYSLKVFASISTKKWYAQRMRLEYCFLLTDVNAIRKRVKVYLEYFLGYINIIRSLFYYQLIKPNPVPNPDRIFAFYSSNFAYFQSLKPVLLALAEKENVTFLCSDAHFKKLHDKLSPEIIAKTVILESMVFGNRGSFFRFFRILSAFFIGISGGIWFAFRGMKRSLTFSSCFNMYAATEYYFGKDIRKYYTHDTRVLASSEHWVWESLYMLAAMDTKTKSYIFQHGAIGDYTYPLFASKFLSWGTIDKEKMVDAFEARPDEIEVVGSPYFDSVYQRVQQYKKTDSQFNQKYIVFLGQPLMGTNFVEPGYYEEFLNRFYALQPLAESLGKKLLVKLHPADKASDYYGRPNYVDISHDPLMDVLADTCLAITVDSTSIFEAMLFGIPCYQIGIDGMFRKNDYSYSGVCMRENTGEGLYKSVSSLLMDKVNYDAAINKSNEAFPKYYFGLGSSIPRILDLLQAGN